MARVVCLFAVVALVQVAVALDCYSCDRTTCQEDISKWQKIPSCGKSTVGNAVGACLKQVYTDKTTQKEVTLRRCIVATKNTDGSITHSCNDNDGKTSVCEVCTSDLCNSAPAVNFSFVALLGVIVAYLIPKLM